MYDDDTQSIVVEGNEGYQKAKNYMKLMMPKQIKKVKKFSLFNNVESFERMFSFCVEGKKMVANSFSSNIGITFCNNFV